MTHKFVSTTIGGMNNQRSGDTINTEFDWRIYADATFAGLSELIPIPMVDWVFSEMFRRRVAASIARQRGRDIPPESLKAVNRQGCGCLFLLLFLPIEVVKRVSRTILYFFTIYAAARSLSANWQRAFLLDYSIQRGHLDKPLKAQVTAEAIEKTLKANKKDPLLQLAREVIGQSRHILRSMMRVSRQNKEDETVDAAREQMASSWENVRGNLVELAWHYDAQWQTRYAEVSGEESAVPPIA